MTSHIDFLSLFKLKIVQAGCGGRLLSDIVQDMAIPASICVLLAHSAMATSPGGYAFLDTSHPTKNVDFGFSGASLSSCLCVASTEEQLYHWGMDTVSFRSNDIPVSLESLTLKVLSLIGKSEVSGMLLSEIVEELVHVDATAAEDMVIANNNTTNSCSSSSSGSPSIGKEEANSNIGCAACDGKHVKHTCDPSTRVSSKKEEVQRCGVYG